MNSYRTIQVLVYTSFYLILSTITCLQAWARGGGGCFEQGTRIDSPEGPKIIEDLRPGDWVWGNVKGRRQKTHVLALSKVTPEYYLKLTLRSGELHVTDEHLFATDSGEFRRAKSLKIGDEVITWHKNRWEKEPIISIVRIQAEKPAFNLLVERGATYIVNGVLVHNKGCFLPDTPVLRADGTSSSISKIRPGDEVKAYEIDGTLVTTKVNKILTHQVNAYYIVKTEKSLLKVTGEHPFYVGQGKFKTVESLHNGELIYAFDGNGLRAESIMGIKKINTKTEVYNLQTNEPHTYFASGIAVHNKGGGFGGGHGGYHSGHGRGGGSADDFWTILFNFGLFFFVIYLVSKRSDKQKKDENLDFNYPRNIIERKSSKTLKLLEFIARQDKTMSPEALINLTRMVFLKLQTCWESREYQPMLPFLMPDLYKQHQLQIAGMINNHEINRIEDLTILYIDLVNVRYTEKKEQREFTSLITASARDYYVDDRTNKTLRGDSSKETFQEFWTFQWYDSGWLLREIEQTRESDILKEENYFEQFTDHQVEKIYQDKVDKLGEVGPWLTKDIEAKANKVDRMLNFLVQSDKMWDRQSMLNRARQVFSSVHLALEFGKLNDEVAAQLFPAVALQFIERINVWNASGSRIEYRNFCVRKVEILLVKHFNDKSQDEFTTRISAHAQRIHLQNNIVVSQDEDVVPFEEYWTFGRLDGTWKLKEALPKALESKIVTSENVDEDTSPDMVKWYYTKKRAM